MSEILDFIAKNQPVAKASVLDAMGRQIDRLVADGTLVAEIGGEVLFYSIPDRHGYPFQADYERRQAESLPEVSKSKTPVPLTFTCIPEKQQEVKQLF